MSNIWLLIVGVALLAVGLSDRQFVITLLLVALVACIVGIIWAVRGINQCNRELRKYQNRD